MNFLKTKIVGAMTGLLGVLITPLIARGLVAVASQVEKLDPALAAQIPQQEIQAWLMGLIAAGISYAFFRPVKEGVKELQRDLGAADPLDPVKVDGLPFAKTQRKSKAALHIRGNPARR